MVGGTLIGARTFSITGKTYVVDEDNDLISYIEFNPDERYTFNKWISRTDKFADYFKYNIYF